MGSGNSFCLFSARDTNNPPRMRNTSSVSSLCLNQCPNLRNNSQRCWPKNVGSCRVRLHVASRVSHTSKPLFQSVLTWYELLVLETDVCPKFHLFCWLPDSVHTIFSERFPAPVFTRTLRVPIAFPFMWYQNLIHCPLGSVAKNRSLYSLALSPGLLGEEASMNIYLPIPSPVNENALTIVSDTAHKQ